MKSVFAALLAAITLTVGCATKPIGLASQTTTVVGLELQYDATAKTPTLRFGIVRHANATVSTNCVNGLNMIQSTDAESRGWMNGRVHTSLAIGSASVTNPAAATQMDYPAANATGFLQGLMPSSTTTNK